MSAIRLARRHRRGISFIEFLGCFIAVAGGVVLGSMYLGVDVHGTAVTLLERADVIAKPEPPTPAPPHKAATGGRAPALETAPPPTPEPTTPTPPQETLTEAISYTPEERAELTRAYWEALNEQIQTELHHRVNRIAADGEWELYDYLTSRSVGHKTAAEKIAQLSFRGVDGHVTAYAKKVQAWHAAGATLYARAKDLLTDAPTAQLGSPFAQSWQSSATQHQMEERLLKEKHQAVQSYLDHAGQ